MSNKKQVRFMQLYEPIHDRFERFCRARVYGEMDHGDLMNETLLRAFDKFDTLKSDDAFLSFLFGIAIRVLANDHRKDEPYRRFEFDCRYRPTFERTGRSRGYARIRRRIGTIVRPRIE